MKKSPIALVAALGIVLGLVATTAISAIATNKATPEGKRRRKMASISASASCHS